MLWAGEKINRWYVIQRDEGEEGCDVDMRERGLIYLPSTSSQHLISSCWRLEESE